KCGRRRTARRGPGQAALRRGCSSERLRSGGAASSLYQRAEGVRLPYRDVGQDLAVEFDTRAAQARDEVRVGQALLTGSGVDASDPEATEVGLLVAAIAVRVILGVEEC